MSSKNNLQQCKSGADFKRYALHHGATTRQGKGSHVVVETSKGATVVPVHGNHDLGTGLRHKIIKAFIAIGLVIILASCVLSAIRTV